MPDATFRPPFLRNILLGIALCGVIFAVVGALPQLVKWGGLPFMYIPSTMGITQMVWPADVRGFNLAESPATLQFDAPGRYALYAADWDLLVNSDASTKGGREPWLHLDDPATGQSLAITGIERGLRPYDSPFAPGRPVYTFVVTRAGDYVLRAPVRYAEVAVVPDHVTGRERVLARAITAQLAVIILPLAIMFTRRYRSHQVMLRARQQEKRRQADAFWSRHTHRGNHVK